MRKLRGDLNSFGNFLIFSQWYNWYMPNFLILLLLLYPPIKLHSKSSYAPVGWENAHFSFCFVLFVCLFVCFFLNSLLIKILTFRNRCPMTPTQGQIIRVHGVLPLAMDNCLRFKLLWPTIGQNRYLFCQEKKNQLLK